MPNSLRNQMTFHGAIVILLGLLAGFPFAFVLLGTMSGEVRAWRMAHLEGVLNGLLVIAAAAVLRRLSLGDRQRSVLAWSLIVMAYGNVVASTIAATFGVRGLAPEAPFANLVVYSLFMIAVVGVFVGVGLMAWGARPGAGGSTAQEDRVEVEVRTPATSARGNPRRRRRRKSDETTRAGDEQ